VALLMDCDQVMQAVLARHVVRIDKPKFIQVIRNLVSNALKFTPAEGSVTVQVEARCEDETGSARETTVNGPRREGDLCVARRAVRYSVLRVTVSDTGAGISEVTIV
jgi:signal transduction histidine kinase